MDMAKRRDMTTSRSEGVAGLRDRDMMELLNESYTYDGYVGSIIETKGTVLATKPIFHHILCVLLHSKQIQ